ncbi:twin-arginine translocase subunit TatC [Cellvibrio japonicus]|uniref:Sec-independent protein translocase protein TatC n=1 Tax=Cellvibrio japonicus (strain Ueda107) TaxID=498211 RepID=B3PIX7_CELJU|nr:twin-arginine translocase subunit TatC [Cellvibrio japonicus]ACE85846.1 Sec-independent protein translocase TatC [Cellvibrio japonicus Ueda107]QEI11186.1 twin-arginine translocase subunit TatC [Cellvibrio japonicus]QEI14760.1 twin-arginine translocase subunit TatC [Cellvibrio japonicus]QEI18340.1 twin-arginine translocase subunit TatC [Cellvibrio japonicus]
MNDHSSVDLSRAPLLSHLVELRKRLLLCLMAFVLAFIACYLVAEQIYQFLMQPLVDILGEEPGRRMIYTGLHEAFITYLKLAFFAALFITLPLILIQLWKFIAPGLYRHEKRGLSLLFAMTPVLFVAGAALAYYLVFPLAWSFFISFETTGLDGNMPVQLEARVSEYLGLVIQLILAFGLSFELPVILLLLAHTGALTADSLVKGRRYAIVGIYALAALITPPDLISQIALGTPILLLYEVSIWLIRWQEKTRTKPADKKPSANKPATQTS